MALEDGMAFSQALMSLSGQIQQLSMQRTFEGAGQAVEQIKNSELSEAEQKIKIKSVANQLAMKMMAMGQPMDRVQGMMETLAPGPSREDLMNKEFGFQEKLQSQRLDASAKQDEVAYARQLALQKTKFNQARALAEMKYGHWEERAIPVSRQDSVIDEVTTTASKPSVIKLSPESKQPVERQAEKPRTERVFVPNKPKVNPSVAKTNVQFKTNARIAMTAANELEETVKEFGNFESVLGNQKAKAKLESAQYQLAINYAKIVDPESVAKEGEVVAAQKYMVPMGLGVRNAQTIESIKMYKQRIAQYMKERAKAAQEEGISTEQEQPLDQPVDDDISNFLE